jgi:lipopolysaccharide biosynthesis regulator YciM
VQFQRALQQNAPAAPVQFLLGAARAMQSRDPDAIAAWQAALSAGQAPAITSRLLVDAYLRRNDIQRASELIASAGAASTDWMRAQVATQIASRREADAAALLERHLASHPDDQDARWLLLHTTYALWVRDPASAAAQRDTFRSHARTYIDAKAPNAALASEWLKAIS